MASIDKLMYTGKRAVVTGGSSGMGDQVVRLVKEFGGDVTVLDINPPRQAGVAYIRTDMSEKQSVEAAAQQMDGPIDALFNCAGLSPFAAPPLKLMMIHVVGHRHLTDLLLPKMPAGSAIVAIASTAGRQYMENMAPVQEFLAVRDWDAARSWAEQHPQENPSRTYGFSKECLIVDAMMRAKDLGARGIRINTISPGPTETDFFGGDAEFLAHASKVQGFLGRNGMPEDQAWACVFLNSDAAAFISGTNLNVDAGMLGAVATGVVQWGIAAPPAAVPAR